MNARQFETNLYKESAGARPALRHHSEASFFLAINEMTSAPVTTAAADTDVASPPGTPAHGPEGFSVERLQAFSRLAALTVLAIILLVPALLFNVRQFVERDQVLADEVLIFSRVIATLPESRSIADSAQQDVWRNIALNVFGTEVSLRISTSDAAMIVGPQLQDWPTTEYESQFTTPQGTHVQVSIETSLRDRLPWMLLFLLVSVLLYGLSLQALDTWLFRPWRRTEAERIRAMERVRDIAGISSDWFWETDPQGRLRLFTMPAAGQALLDEPPLGRCFWELQALLPAGGWTSCRLAMAAQKPFVQRYEVRTPDGILSHEIRGKPVFDGKGRYKGHRGAGRDITADVERERELARHRDELSQLVDEQTAHLMRMSRDADAANRAKSMFLATMSHEIRTPLNSIIGLTYLAQQASRQEDRDRHLTDIAGAGSMLMSLINDILDLSKIEAGKLALEILPFEVQGLLDEAVGMMKSRIEAKGLQLRTELDCDIQRVLLGDRHRLLQVLVNFLSNAAKFTSAGEVSIRISCRKMGGEHLELRLEVSDTGIGLSREQQTRVFQPFDQATSGTTRQFGGTGLGLAIVKSLADLMGGQVGVFSEPGKGASFWFTARVGMGKPVAGSSQAFLPADAGSVPTGALAGRRVLAVDDDPLHLKVLSDILGRKGAVVVAVADIDSAMKAVDSPERFDAVLLDIYLDKESGIDLARRLRLLPQLAVVPMFAVSASASTEERERCREAGMVDLIAKPLSANTLLGRILPWLRPLDEGPAPAPVRPALRRAVSSAKAADAAAPVPAVSELPVEELLRLLDEGSLEAVDLARRHERALLVWLAPEQTQWTDALSRFDFTSAAALLRDRLAATPGVADPVTKETTSA